MIIKSIQINDNNISIAYQKPSATGLTDIFTLKSKDDPRPELLKAFGHLQQIVKKNFEFFDEFNIPFVASAFKFKYGTIEGLVSRVGVEGVVSDINTPNEFKFKTDWLNVEYADSTFAISVQDLIDECVRFIMGRRAQDSLFNDSEE
ncbi:MULTISPECIES: hypothetical protein [Veillonella]|uniref:hypothetical protein n=1 Tax=Veillonella TaxID=29465 RepID=UPI00290DB558|nr:MULTISPECIES: hypothetical protein [Veillonella]MDU4007361.1 hypothetical protein [Veillonella sp.]MDU7280686.1 hypothetical protein [Veillonella parvula]